jgi:hypothetical protein
LTFVRSRVVQCVEKFGANFQRPGFLEPDAAAKAKIDVELIRAFNAVPSGIAGLAGLVLSECGSV